MSTVDAPTSGTDGLVIYGDFNCPFSALASSRAAILERRGVAVDWRAVDHDPSIPPSGEPVTATVAATFADELAQIRRLLEAGEEDRLRVPSTRVNTWLACRGFAACPTEARPALREALFDAYWRGGLNLGDNQVVRRLCGERRDETTASRWREQWAALPSPLVPVMVLPDGYVSRGLGALTRLGDMARAEAPATRR